MIGNFFRNVFIAMGLITLLIIFLIKATLLNVENILVSTKQRAACRNSLNA